MVCLAALASPARAQQPTPPAADSAQARTAADTAADSLRARLQRAEEAIALLQQQLATQAASATQTATRARFELSGRVLVNGFANSRRVNNVDVPQFVRPDTVAGVRQGGLGASIRQTTVTGAAFVPRVLGAEFRGDLTVDFFGGQPQPSPGAAPNPGGRHFPLVRLRLARAFLRWRDVEVMAGHDVPLVAAVEPVSLAAIGVPEFGTAGNLWLWLPQLRLAYDHPIAFRDTRGPLRLGAQVGVLAPNNGDQIGTAGAIETDFDLAERSRRPYVQGRVYARWGEEDNAGEIGLGVHRGWIAPNLANTTALATSEAVVATALVPLGRFFDLRGEAYAGQAVRGLGGGGIAQTFISQATPTTPARPLRTRAGWAQANLRLGDVLTLGGGAGIDAPRDDGFPALPAFRRENRVYEAHAIARPEGPLVIGLTYRRLRTQYAARAFANDHANLAIGFQF
jgi:hypothetical protein